MSVNKVGVRMIAAKGPLVAICPLPCLLAQAILTRKLTNLSFLTHRMTETTVCVLYYSIVSLSFVMEQRCVRPNCKQKGS